MLNRLILTGVGLALLSGAALAAVGEDADLSAPSTNGTGAMEQPSSQIDDAGDDERSDPSDAAEGTGIGTMGAGARGTTDGMGATTGTDSIDGDDEEGRDQ